MLALPIAEVPFAFLDTETTGLSPRGGGRICEVAVLTIQGGRPVGDFQSLVNPEGPIDPAAVRIHGISDEMVAESPTFRRLAKRLHGLLEGKTLVCHNAPFDVGFLTAEFARAGLKMPAVPVVDTLRLCRRHFRFERNSLGFLAQALGVAVEGWHRAGSDVRILSGVFSHLMEDLRRRGTRTLEDLMKLGGCP